MKIISIITKSLKEQIRSSWILLLSLSMGPFFIIVYFLIMESSKPDYTVLIANNDTGVLIDGQKINHGNNLTVCFKSFKTDKLTAPFNVIVTSNKFAGIESIKNNKADALIIISDSFSRDIDKRRLNDSTTAAMVEFIGDLTNTEYLISAVWANEVLNEYALLATHNKRVAE